MSRKLLFIVNPRSGKKNSGEIIDAINKTLPDTLSYEIALWTNINEFNSIATKLSQRDAFGKKGNFTDAIAVGGDGSVNLVAKTILNTELTLGIVPAGSGNGLARSLGIYMNTEKALQQIIEGKTKLIDSGEVNGHAFFCTSGVGFDAHIGNLFANLSKRGLKTYIKLIWKEFFNYKPKTYTIIANGKELKREAFFITVANAGQFGNEFYIAPDAKLNDGLFNVVIVKPAKLLQALALILKIVRGKANKSKYIETFTCNELIIKRDAASCVHFDGEPSVLEANLAYSLNPKSIKVIVGSGFKSA